MYSFLGNRLWLVKGYCSVTRKRKTMGSLALNLLVSDIGIETGYGNSRPMGGFGCKLL